MPNHGTEVKSSFPHNVVKIQFYHHIKNGLLFPGKAVRTDNENYDERNIKNKGTLQY